MAEVELPDTDNNFIGFRMAQATALFNSLLAEWEVLKPLVDSIHARVTLEISDEKESYVVVNSRAELQQWSVQLGQKKTTLLESVKPGITEEAQALFPRVNKLIIEITQLEFQLNALVETANYYIAKKDGSAHAPIPGSPISGASYDSRQLAKMELPLFDGDILCYKEWRAEVAELLSGSMTDQLKVIRLKKCVTGDAAQYIGTQGSHFLSSEALLNYLDKRYLDDFHVNQTLINKFIELVQAPPTDVASLLQMPDRLHNLETAMLSRKFDLSHLITSVMLALMPSGVKTEVIKRVQIYNPEDKVFKWEHVHSHIYQTLQELVAIHDKSEPLENLVFANRIVASTTQIKSNNSKDTVKVKANSVNANSHNSNNSNNNNNTNNNNQRWKNGNNNKNKSRYTVNKLAICLLCNEYHPTRFCYRYPTESARINAAKSSGKCLTCARKHPNMDSSLTDEKKCLINLCSCCDKPFYVCKKLALEKASPTK